MTETLVHPPPQPRNDFPLLGTAVSDTDEFAGKGAAHVEPQVIPEGELMIVPSIAPAVTVTDRLCVAVLVGQPSLAGPSTVVVIVPTTRLPLVSPLVYTVAEIFAMPHTVPAVN